MRQSKLFTKASRELPKDEVSLNAQLLIRAGFINKEIAGVYAYLPFGLRVLNKIIKIIKEEMEAIGGVELSLTALQNAETWKKTGRWDDKVMDVWFKTKIGGEQEAGLAPTHEEPLTAIMKKHINSYKDLPVYVYQVQTKFRNEKRSKSGILRGREFLMKDLYSFNLDATDFGEFYEKAKEAYVKIFDRCGLGEKTFVTFASGGSFSKYSHEFQTVCSAGEDIIYVDSDKKIAVNKEVYNDEVLGDLGLKKSDLKEEKAIEVGNIFDLGTRFSEALGLSYLDEKGEKKMVHMGCYGIGPGRVMGTVVELSHDDKGIIWPEEIAPFKVHLIQVKSKDEAVKQEAEKLYVELLEKGIETLYDDREEVSAGQKFAEADLIGCPYRLVISEKTLKENSVEVKKRNEEKAELVKMSDVVNTLLARQ